MKIRRRIKGEHDIIFNLKVWQKKYAFDILKNISEYITLVQLMYSLGNVNNAISIVGYCKFYPNYEKAMCLTKGSLDIICSPSVGDKQVAIFQSLFYAVRYIWAPIHIKNVKNDTVS